jgi:hypothetical protein
VSASVDVIPRVLVIPELRWLDFGDAPDDSPFARPGARQGLVFGGGAGLSIGVGLASEFGIAEPVFGAALGAALGRLVGALWLRPRGPQPAFTPWGVKLERAYPWAEVVAVQVSVGSRSSSGGLGGGDTRERTIALSLYLAGWRRPVTARGPYQSNLEGLPQLLPRYRVAASRPIALDPHGHRVVQASEPGALPLLFAAAKDAGAALLEGSVGYREHRPTMSKDGVATLRRALVEEPWAFDLGPLAAVVAAEHGVSELADEIGHLILSPCPRVAGVAKVAAERLGLGPIVTGSLSEVAPLLPQGDLEALEAWRAKAPLLAPR